MCTVCTSHQEGDSYTLGLIFVTSVQMFYDTPHNIYLYYWSFILVINPFILREFKLVQLCTPLHNNNWYVWDAISTIVYNSQNLNTLERGCIFYMSTSSPISVNVISILNLFWTDLKSKVTKLLRGRIIFYRIFNFFRYFAFWPFKFWNFTEITMGITQMSKCLGRILGIRFSWQKLDPYYPSQNSADLDETHTDFGNMRMFVNDRWDWELLQTTFRDYFIVKKG